MVLFCDFYPCMSCVVSLIIEFRDSQCFGWWLMSYGNSFAFNLEKHSMAWIMCYDLALNFLRYKYILFLTSTFNCRKKKAVHKTTTTDDKRLQSTLKRIGVNAIPAIEEVNIFKDDVVIQFTNPKGKANWNMIWDC